MSRNRDALNREMRQLLVLGFLRRRRGRARVKEVKGAFYFVYPGMTEVATHRRFSDDMDDLRRADLIDYADLRLNMLVSLTVPQKDPQMFLTLGEHEALRHARERLRWKSVASPFPSDPGTQKLAYVVEALRLIEEGNTEVADLAAALNVRPRKVQQILDRLDRINLIDRAVSDGVTDQDTDALQSARKKLEAWRSRLEQLGT